MELFPQQSGFQYKQNIYREPLKMQTDFDFYYKCSSLLIYFVMKIESMI